MSRFPVSILTILVLLASQQGWPAEQQAPKTVSYVDLKKYTGTWFEIARYPNRFQKKCIGNVQATYTLRSNSKISVLNQCLEESGKTKIANGKAVVTDSVTNSKLKVTFFWPFYGNYWILDLDQNYTYAVVGEPDRKYLWILSRTPEIDPHLYSEILERIKDQGYDTTKLIRTKHSTPGSTGFF